MFIRRYGTTNGEYDCAWYGMVGPIRSDPVRFGSLQETSMCRYISIYIVIYLWMGSKRTRQDTAQLPPPRFNLFLIVHIIVSAFLRVVPTHTNQQASLPGLPLHPRHRPPRSRAGAEWQEVAKVQGIGRQLLDRELYQPSAHGRRPRWAERYIFRRDRACRYGG